MTNSSVADPATIVTSSAWIDADERNGCADIVDTLRLDGGVLSIVREVRSGVETCAQLVGWRRTYEDADYAKTAFDALNARPSELLLWSAGALALGREWLSPTLDGLIAHAMEERLEADRRSDTALMQEEVAAQESGKLTAYTLNHQGSFRITLERGHDDVALWWIDFDERWERDRFYDWFAWQGDRYERFVAEVDAERRFDLEKQLLREMLTTEQAVKKQGLGSGGRRPLRFWRGEL